MLEFSLLDSQSTLRLFLGDGILTQEMELFPTPCAIPNEVSLDSVDVLNDFSWELNVLHNMGRDVGKCSLSEDGSTSHVKMASFPFCQLILHIVQDELEVYVLVFFIKDGVPQVFSKFIASSDVKNVRAKQRGLRAAISRKDNPRLGLADFLARIIAKFSKGSYDGGAF